MAEEEANEPNSRALSCTYHATKNLIETMGSAVDDQVLRGERRKGLTPHARSISAGLAPAPPTTQGTREANPRKVRERSQFVATLKSVAHNSLALFQGAFLVTNEANFAAVVPWIQVRLWQALPTLPRSRTGGLHPVRGGADSGVTAPNRGGWRESKKCANEANLEST